MEVEELSFEITTEIIHGIETRFLNIKSLPFGISTRFGVDLSKVLVRQSYEELYDLVTLKMLAPSQIMCDRSVSKLTFLFHRCFWNREIYFYDILSL